MKVRIPGFMAYVKTGMNSQCKENNANGELTKSPWAVLLVAIGIVLVVLTSINTHALTASDAVVSVGRLAPTAGTSAAAEGAPGLPGPLTSTGTEGTAVDQGRGNFFVDSKTGPGSSSSSSASRRRLQQDTGPRVRESAVVRKAKVIFQLCAEKSVLGAVTMTESCCRVFGAANVAHWSCSGPGGTLNYTKTEPPAETPGLTSASASASARARATSLAWLFDKDTHATASDEAVSHVMVNAFSRNRDAFTHDEAIPVGSLAIMSSEETGFAQRYCLYPFVNTGCYYADAKDWAIKKAARCENCFETLRDIAYVKRIAGLTTIASTLYPGGNKLQIVRRNQATDAWASGVVARNEKTTFTFPASTVKCIVPTTYESKNPNLNKKQVAGLFDEPYYAGLIEAGQSALKTADGDSCIAMYTYILHEGQVTLAHTFQPLVSSHWSSGSSPAVRGIAADDDKRIVSEQYLVRDILQEETVDGHIDPWALEKAQCAVTGADLAIFETETRERGYENIRAVVHYAPMVWRNITAGDSTGGRIESCPSALDMEAGEQKPPWLSYVPCRDGDLNRRIFDNTTCCCAKITEANVSPGGPVRVRVRGRVRVLFCFPTPN